MKQYTTKATILNLRSGNASYYGNPSYFVSFENENGDYLCGKTASNSSAGYVCSNDIINKNVKITYHYTKNNNLIIDYIKE